MIRLFIALNIPEDVKLKLIEIRNSVAGSNYMWEVKEKLHLTLKFIGDVPEASIESIAEELDFVQNYPSLKSEIFNFDFFFRDKKPAILLAGLKIDQSIYKIVDELNTKLEKFSIQKEVKKFNPHLTLLRIKNDFGNNFVNNFKNFTFEPIDFTANSISLIKSELYPSRSKYFEIKNYKLKELEI